MAQTRNTKKIFNYAYGIGASIVILGALFKIQHWAGGGMMLTIGMAVEALVFFVSAFDSVEDDLDWSLVYPELAGGEPTTKKEKKGGSISQQLDAMLAEAKIGPDLIQSLGTGLQSLSTKSS